MCECECLWLPVCVMESYSRSSRNAWLTYAGLSMNRVDSDLVLLIPYHIRCNVEAYTCNDCYEIIEYFWGECWDEWQQHNGEQSRCARNADESIDTNSYKSHRSLLRTIYVIKTSKHIPHSPRWWSLSNLPSMFFMPHVRLDSFSNKWDSIAIKLNALFMKHVWIVIAR